MRRPSKSRPATSSTTGVPTAGLLYGRLPGGKAERRSGGTCSRSTAASVPPWRGSRASAATGLRLRPGLLAPAMRADGDAAVEAPGSVPAGRLRRRRPEPRPRRGSAEPSPTRKPCSRGKAATAREDDSDTGSPPPSTSCSAIARPALPTPKLTRGRRSGRRPQSGSSVERLAAQSTHHWSRPSSKKRTM